MTTGERLAEETARWVLLGQRVAKLPADVLSLRFRVPIIIDSIQHYCSITAVTMDKLSCGTDFLRDGCTIVRKKRGRRLFIILYNGEIRSKKRRAFTLAHEVGHILLEHERDDYRAEREADCFAAELMIPRVLILACLESGACCGPEELAGVFGVSRTMATVRLDTIRQEGNFTDLEVKLLRRYRHLLPVPGEIPTY